MDIIFQLQLMLAFLVFLSVVIMNIAKRNSTLIILYLLQSLMLVGILGVKAFNEKSIELSLVLTVLFFVKVIVAPQVLFRLITQSKITHSASTYLSVPMTLGCLVLISIFAQSDIFSPFTTLVSQLRILLVGSILMSLFLIINRKGALSQIMGVLSLENCIFTFGYFIGLQQSAVLEVGMIFDIFFWIIISSIFVKMIFTHFGSIDVTQLKELKK